MEQNCVQAWERRIPGIDLLRCLGLLMVVSVHFFLYNGFYSELQQGSLMWFWDSVRWLCFGCNGVFMMLTGFLMSGKPLDGRYYLRLVPVLVSYTLTCLISYPIRHFVQGETLSLQEWIHNFLSFSNYSWYIEMYIGLILFSPFLNLALRQVQRPGHLLALAGVMVVLTALPDLTGLDLLPDYWTGLYPITYYVIGAVLSRIRPQISAWRCLLAAAAAAMGQGFASVLMTDGTFAEGLTAGYGGTWVTLTVTLLFLGIFSVSVSARFSRLLSWLSEGCLEGFLLSRLFDTWVYDLLPRWHTPKKYGLLYLCVTIPIFFASILLGKLVHGLSRSVSGRLLRKCGFSKK